MNKTCPRGGKQWGDQDPVSEESLFMALYLRLGVETGPVVGAAFFAGGDGSHGCVRLTGCDLAVDAPVRAQGR